MNKRHSRLLTFPLILELLFGPAAASFGIQAGGPIPICTYKFHKEFQAQALAAVMENVLWPISNHFEGTYHRNRGIAMQPYNTFAGPFDNQLREMNSFLSKIEGVLNSGVRILPDIERGWEAQWEILVSQLKGIAKQIPEGENEWLWELARDIADYLIARPNISLREYQNLDQEQMLAQQILEELKSTMKKFRAYLYHRLILDSRKLSLFVGRKGPLPVPLRIVPSNKIQKYFQNEFFDKLLLGMVIGLLREKDPDGIRTRVEIRDYLNAMVEGARGVQREHDLHGIWYGEPVAMQPPPETPTPIDFTAKAAAQLGVDKNTIVLVNRVAYSAIDENGREVSVWIFRGTTGASGNERQGYMGFVDANGQLHQVGPVHLDMTSLVTALLAKEKVVFKSDTPLGFARQAAIALGSDLDHIAVVNSVPLIISQGRDSVIQAWRMNVTASSNTSDPWLGVRKYIGLVHASGELEFVGPDTDTQELIKTFEKQANVVLSKDALREAGLLPRRTDPVRVKRKGVDAIPRLLQQPA